MIESVPAIRFMSAERWSSALAASGPALVGGPARPLMGAVRTGSLDDLVRPREHRRRDGQTNLHSRPSD